VNREIALKKNRQRAALEVKGLDIFSGFFAFYYCGALAKHHNLA